MIFAVIGILSALGCVLYLQVYNMLDKYGAWMAFAVIVGFDALWLIILLFFIAIGKYGNPAPGTEEHEEANFGAEIKEGVDLDEIMGDIAEQEKKNDPYDDKMLDPDEEYERSTRRGSMAAKVVKKRKGSLNEQLLDDQDEDYDYDFDNEHFRQGSVYTKRDNTDNTTERDDYAAINKDSSGRLRSTS